MGPTNDWLWEQSDAVDRENIRTLLEQVHAGELTPEAAMTALRWAPYEDLGFARVDTHRQLRTGVPEIVFCQGKTAEQVVEIVRRLAERGPFVLATRAGAEHAEALRGAFPNIVHHEAARILELRPAPGNSGASAGGAQAEGTAARPSPIRNPQSAIRNEYVLVVSAGTADIPVAEEAVVTARALGSRVERLYDVGVAGLHRLLGQRDLLLGANVLVVVAGMEGALPSVVGGLVERPVIAVPTSVGYGAHFHGLAPLLTMLNSCATGVGVVNIDNGFGAGYLAHLINITGERRPAAGPTSADEGRKGGAIGSTPLDAAPAPTPPTPPASALSESVTVIEANLDDMNPQIYDHVMDRLFEAGALDVTLTPIQMKKNRPAVTLSVICDPAQAGSLAEILFAETTTLGVRMSRWERLCLERQWVTAETPWGAVRVKLGRRAGQVVTRTPEYDDCKRVARAAGVPLKQVQQAALAQLLANS